MEWVIDALIQDLSGFLRLPPEEVNRRLKPNYYNPVWYDEWMKRHKYDYDKWLRESEYYLYDLTQWHIKSRVHLLSYWRGHPEGAGKSACDFGSGIGTRGIFMTLKGYRVTMAEINRPCFSFTKYRLRKHGVKAVIKERLNGSERFDLVLLIDVIGHLTKPIPTIEHIVNCMNSGVELRVTWDNWYDSGEGRIHRNKEIDFHSLLLSLGLERISKTAYTKR